MTKKEQFHAIRRSYRIAKKRSARYDENAVYAFVAAVSALRAFTGNWDCCEPMPHGQMLVVKHPRLWIRTPFVAAACTRWIASH